MKRLIRAALVAAVFLWIGIYAGFALAEEKPAKSPCMDLNGLYLRMIHNGRAFAGTAVDSNGIVYTLWAGNSGWALIGLADEKTACVLASGYSYRFHFDGQAI